MIIVSVVLFWLPALGPLIAGYVGGKKAGGVVKGITAALLPAILIAVIIFAGTSFLANLPVIGAILGLSTILIVAIYELPLIGGAVVGGALA